MAIWQSLSAFSLFLSFVVASPLVPRYDVNIPQVINNCSGNVHPPLPDHIASAPGYAPQMPASGKGWEEWLLIGETLVVNDTENVIFYARWSRGDPTSQYSSLEDGSFTFMTSFANGSVWKYAVEGPVVYGDVGGIKTWAVGDNKLTFDGTTGFWNHSMTHEGFSFHSFTDM